MKTTEEVCRKFGFEYAPMRISFKKKVFKDGTPVPNDSILLKQIAIIMGVCLASLVLGFCIIAWVTQ